MELQALLGPVPDELGGSTAACSGTAQWCAHLEGSTIQLCRGQASYSCTMSTAGAQKVTICAGPRLDLQRDMGLCLVHTAACRLLICIECCSIDFLFFGKDS